MNIPNPFACIMDTLREGQARTIKRVSEESCFSCGEHFAATWDHYRWWKDNGEEFDGFFCNDCIEKRRDQLL